VAAAASGACGIEDRDSVSDDLLEEYRESIVPALRNKAPGWYVRQVYGYVLRKAWIWSALVGAILVTRYLFEAPRSLADASLSAPFRFFFSSKRAVMNACEAPRQLCRHLLP
jgi:hypothetical protein